MVSLTLMRALWKTQFATLQLKNTYRTAYRDVITLGGQNHYTETRLGNCLCTHAITYGASGFSSNVKGGKESNVFAIFPKMGVMMAKPGHFTEMPRRR